MKVIFLDIDGVLCIHAPDGNWGAEDDDVLSESCCRRLKEILKRKQREKGLQIRVIMHPTVLARLKNDDAELLRELENEYGQALSFRADPTIPIEQFKLVDPQTNEEY